jgi:hypothetical protein
MDHLSAHLDQWMQLVGQYGQKLVQFVPEQLRTDFIAIIPDELEKELEDPLNAHIQTYTQIVEWCKSRTTKSRQKVLAARRLKQVGVATGRMAPLTTETQGDVMQVEEPPTWAAPLIAALKQGH